MLKQKPVRKPGQDLRTLPTYTIPEASGFLAINPRTLFSWYEGAEPILKASGYLGSTHLLSYRDIEEAYRVYLLRERFDFSLQFLRKSMLNARRMFGSQHPLQRAEAIKECLKDIVYDKPARGTRPRTITSLGQRPGQQIVEEVVNLFGERIETGSFIFPWRFAATDHASRPVSMNPNIMSGRLVVAGTRIPVYVLLDGKRAGMSMAEIANDYGIDDELVKKALIHIGLRQKAA
ncbi:MAG TPA: DUF433 domain-containing protein [Terracidiphilus sp.]|jgi:uncharacterized protein (DUF433 family)|nr:DUF433 domain-containing protein [Terracidiphilus sp.]